MSKPRVMTDDQDRANAEWFEQLRELGNVQQRAKELGVSVSALYDSIARGQNKPTAGERFKISEYERDVSRESNDSDGIEAA